jgi:coenzyme F420-0:L-glutamate ligase/coenzyme F420-1:gamma-L-glutamate ligase
MSAFSVRPVTGIGEVTAGTDLAALLVEHAGLADGDVVVVTSKIVSKSEGRVLRVGPGAGREAALAGETDRVVARRGPTSIVRTHHGLVMAAAGIDASNTEPGTLVLLPKDPDLSARLLRAAVRRLTGLDVGVVISDTSGRAWRHGQTDIAVGAAGLGVLDDHAGRTDAYGNQLAVTAPAVADEIAAAGDLAMGKLSGSPVAVLTGLAHVVLPHGEDGPGAAALVRDEATDMFGYGAREAVVNAVLAPDAGRGFGAPSTAEELAAVLEALVEAAGIAGRVEAGPGSVTLTPAEGNDPRAAGRLESGAGTLARAHGWQARAGREGDPAVFRARTP